jgi:DNA polymerase iota
LYRQYSRQIFQHICEIVWDGKVERLGLDEQFCDVTSMVLQHLDDLSKGQPLEDDGRPFFNLNKDRVSLNDLSSGFSYSPDACHGFTLPVSPDSPSTERSRRLQVASHLAAFIRESIQRSLGFSTSAGIAHTKQLCKLAAGLNKPSKQTVWFPNVNCWEDEQAEFLGPFKIESLKGFGSHVVRTLRCQLLKEESLSDNRGWFLTEEWQLLPHSLIRNVLWQVKIHS